MATMSKNAWHQMVMALEERREKALVKFEEAGDEINYGEAVYWVEVLEGLGEAFAWTYQQLDEDDV